MTAPVRRRSLVVGAPEVIERDSPPGRTVVLLIGVLAALALAVWALVDQLTAGSGIELPRLEVPDVTAGATDAAQARLEELGFVVQILYQPNENTAFPKGTVFAQRPRAGAKVPQGDLVTVLVSDGPLGLQVPDVAGQQGAEAVALLQRSGLVGELVPVPDESVRPGQVLGSEPETGQRVPSGGLVRIRVSDGPAPRLVPAVLGMNSAEALLEIGRAGLAPGKIKREVRTDVAAGAVLASDPAPGTPLAKDTPVALTISIAEPRSIVPYVVGLQQGTAAGVVRDAGLQLAVITVPVVAGDPTAGRVVAQGTPPQSDVLNGSVLQITVAVVAEEPAAPGGPSSSTTTPGG